MKKTFYNSNLLILFLFLSLGAGLGAYFMYELKWDFANYHYYGVYALFNGRLGYDVIPAALQTFFNPLIDIPFYFLVEYLNDYPRLVSGIQGLWLGLLLFVFYKILLLFFDKNTDKGKISIILSLLIGATGFSVFSQIGTTTNEIQISILILWSFYLLIKEIYVEKSGRASVFLWAGLILGSAMGLKLTAVIYCLSTGLVLIFFYKSYTQPFKKICLFAVGGLAGFLLFNGWWMWMMWTHYQNPFMPFANEIFKSEYFADMNFRDTASLPKNILHWLFYPIFWSYPHNRFHVWIDFSDIRFTLAYLIAIGYFIALLFKKIKTAGIVNFLIVYCVVGYVVWLVMFSIFRYYIPLEMLIAVCLVKTFWFLMPKKECYKLIYVSFMNIILYVLVTTMFYGDNWGIRSQDETNQPQIVMRKENGNAMQLMIKKHELNPLTDKILNMEQIKLPENTLVLLYNCTTSAFIPLLEKDSDIRAVMVNQRNFRNKKEEDIFTGSKFKEMVKEIVENHSGPKIAIVRRDLISILDINPKNEPYIEKMECTDLKNNVINGIQICYPPELKTEIFTDRKGTENE